MWAGCIHKPLQSTHHRYTMTERLEPNFLRHWTGCSDQLFTHLQLKLTFVYSALLINCQSSSWWCICSLIDGVRWWEVGWMMCVRDGLLSKKWKLKRAIQVGVWSAQGISWIGSWSNVFLVKETHMTFKIEWIVYTTVCSWTFRSYRSWSECRADNDIILHSHS